MSDVEKYIERDGYRVTFQLQNGPVRESGVNGCQIGDVLEWCREMLVQFNTNIPCRETSIAITKVQESLLWLRERERTRTARGVEGTSLP